MILLSKNIFKYKKLIYLASDIQFSKKEWYKINDVILSLQLTKLGVKETIELYIIDSIFYNIS